MSADNQAVEVQDANKSAGDEVEDWLVRRNAKGRPKAIDRMANDELDRRLAQHCTHIADRVARELRTRNLKDAQLSQLGVLYGIMVDKRAVLQGKAQSSITINVRSQALDRIGQLAQRLDNAIGAGRSQKIIDLPPQSAMPQNANYMALPTDPPPITGNLQVAAQAQADVAGVARAGAERVKRSYRRSSIKIDKTLEGKGTTRPTSP